MPEKDPVQETVSLLKSDQSLKTTIGVDAELHLPIWHCETHEAFLMHVSSALDVIKKRGTFKAYKEAHKAYVEQCEVSKQAKANMALFTAPTSKGEKASEKASKKASKKASEKASNKALGRTPLRKRRLLRRPRKVQLCPMHQPQIFAKSTRPFMTMPCLQKRPPRTRKKPLRPRCFSSTGTWHPKTSQILQVLPGKQETQPKVRTCSTQACHINSLESVMCRPSRSLHT
jgi:hypothetical protein